MAVVKDFAIAPTLGPYSVAILIGRSFQRNCGDTDERQLGDKVLALVMRIDGVT